MRLRWKKSEKEKGLSAIGAGPRSSKLTDGKKDYAMVYAIGGNCRGPLRGWYWVKPTDELGPYINTSNNPVPTEEEAKAQALAFVKKSISKKEK